MNRILISLLLLGSLNAQNPILSLMEKELQRSIRLNYKGEFKPYYISYLVIDEERKSVETSMGAIIDLRESKNRYLDVDVRVGDYNFDSSNPPDRFFDIGPEGYALLQEMHTVPVPIENNYAFRKTLWLLTDKAYKLAVLNYLAKRAKKIREIQKDNAVPEFSKEKNEVFIGKEVQINGSLAENIRDIKEISEIFLNYPEILFSSVNFDAIIRKTYFVNTTGSKIQDGHRYFYLHFSIATKAEDGMRIETHRNYFAFTPTGFPSVDSITSDIESSIRTLSKIKNAPIQGSYKGPVLILSPASGVFFHEVLGHRLEGHRQNSRIEGETFADKIGKKILPADVMVHDDPTLRFYKNSPLNGHYMFDEEGVRAQRVLLVEDGILKNFLLSRRPLEKFPHSNGHGRAEPQFLHLNPDAPVARQGNFIVETKSPKSLPRLKEMLREEAKRQGLSYGLIIHNVQGGQTQTSRFSMETFESIPTIVSRIYVKDGKEEYVRGIRFGGTPLISLDKIIAFGDDPKVYNGFCGAESGTVPVSLISPSVLISELEIGKLERSYLRLPVLPPP